MFEDIEEDIFNDDLKILEFQKGGGGLPKKRNLRKNHFDEMDDYGFFRTFRVYKPTALLVLGLIEHSIAYHNPHLDYSLSPINQLLIALKYYSDGEHLDDIARFAGVDTGTVSRTIVRVSEAISNLYLRYCVMPFPRDEQIKFYNHAGFRRIVGIVDGTHIKIKNPDLQEGEIFRNRKGYHSLNTQIVVNSDLQISDVLARWPGSAHDSTIFTNSRICARFENREFGNGILLGDSGYALQEYLLTSLRAPQTRSQIRYNQAFNSTRNIVERTIGIWKSRFRCLAYGLRFKLSTCMAVIVACAVLHNIYRQQNKSEPPVEDRKRLDYYIRLGQIQQNLDMNEIVHGRGGLQNYLINNHFA